MKIGYACIPLGVKYKTNRGFMIKNFTKERLYEAIQQNLLDLLKILEYNVSKGIYLFRISSDIIPFGGHKINTYDWDAEFKDILIKIGEYIKNNNIRVSMHPGQYTIINSPDNSIVENSIREIEYHTLFLDSLELDYTHKVVLHIGGVYKDKSSAMERFCKNFNLLSQSSKKRLVIENDEKNFNIDEVLDISNRISIPAVFDILHHSINPTQDNTETILKKCLETWKKEDGPMKLHYSDQSPTKQKGAHSDYVSIQNFLEFYKIASKFDCDIMLETKDKDISAIKCINTIFPVKKSVMYDEWAKYKYVVMEKDYALYKKCSSIINSETNMLEFYKTIDYALSLLLNEGAVKNTLQHVWGYFKDKANDKEFVKFHQLLSTKEYTKAKAFLKRLAEKYNEEYLLNSYYFIINT
ncbi:UV DNA damage repair endonuclease UvsE [Caloramator sp. ALD01]|uniref:UV DNA damage repair endonuclease UvsE n=1 Tax=Caloramator sp. ALD01 TaxID=1031288 RepID=UPI00040A2A87|nr:UV DNA damage repair endonuclease UvsE [Caloramator sp. ALD01]